MRRVKAAPSSWIRLNLATLALQDGNTAEAKRMIDLALERNPASPRAVAMDSPRRTRAREANERRFDFWISTGRTRSKGSRSRGGEHPVVGCRRGTSSNSSDGFVERVFE
jgi:hypothetical protein